MARSPAKTKTRGQPHPSYPHPTIIEALCEMHFTLVNNAPWKASLVGELYKHVHDEFPTMEPGMDIGLQLDVGPGGIGQSVLPPRPRMRFRHKDRPILLQVAPLLFTVNVLPVYPGWDAMKRDVASAWRRARDAMAPAAVTRIGLRYINRIEPLTEDEAPSSWFKASDFVPEGVLRSRGAFLTRVESQIDDQNRVIVTFGESCPSAENTQRGIVLDIDRIAEGMFSTDEDRLLFEMDRLHEEVWKIFEASQTPRLVDHLNRGSE